MTTIAQYFGHSEAGKEMPSRSSTCDHSVHRICELLKIGGSAAPRAMLKMCPESFRGQILTSSKGLLDPPPAVDVAGRIQNPKLKIENFIKFAA